MAKISWNAIDQTPSATTPANNDTKESKFLKLVNHGDKAHVRFLINQLEDIEIFTTHRAHIKTQLGKEWDVTVECLRSSGDQPVTACPFCESGLKPKTELYMQLYDVDTNSLKIWTRPTSFAERLRAAFNSVIAMGQGRPLVSAVFEITRIGERGSKQTEYTIYPISIDDTTLESLPVKPIDVHNSGCLRAVDWNGARFWQQNGDFPQPEKTAVDQWGRPLDANPAPQAQTYVHNPVNAAPAPQPSFVPPQPQPQPVPPAPQPVPPVAPNPVPVAPTPVAPAPVAQPAEQPADNGGQAPRGRRVRFN